MWPNLVIGLVQLKDGKKDSKNENFSGINIILLWFLLDQLNRFFAALTYAE